MEKHFSKHKSMKKGESLFGFKLIKKEFAPSKNSDFYTLEHEKTKATLFWFDRADENKTFAVSFKTLPEDHTGVFHILEHSVLNGSKKYPVKEPFVSMLQSSMQTFLNAMTYSDKTVFPISSRNEQDFFNLMSVYLDAVFNPMIYKRPEIFMQEGWHYETDESGELYYNGVVYSEMKGVYSDVDSVIEDETSKLLFPDNSYGFSSGGHPDFITDLTYEKFIETHKRFYHPSNAVFFLDGDMEIDKVLKYIDGEYLSSYEYKKPDFDFKAQTPKARENTVYYEAREGEEELAHLSVSKILCNHGEIEKLYGAQILADYLTGSNEGALKRLFLENGLGQDVNVHIMGGVYQPTVSVVVNNIDKKSVNKIKDFIPKAVASIIKEGICESSLSACLERFAFLDKEVSEPYGIELCEKILDGFLYGDDPLTYIENKAVFDSLRSKISTDYFENLLKEIFENSFDKSYLYVLPSLTKGEDDAKREEEKLLSICSAWTKEDTDKVLSAFEKMQQWQQSSDSEQDMASLPHLKLEDVPLDFTTAEKKLITLDTVDVLKIKAETNGIVYLNMYFDVSDFTEEQLLCANVLTSVLGQLSTKNYSAQALSSEIKSVLGSFSQKLEISSKTGDLENAKVYLLVSVSTLEEKAEKAVELIKEILLNTSFDETDKIYDIILQNDYLLKQSLVNNGHTYAITKALSSFSKRGGLQEMLEGESFVKWFSSYAEGFKENEKANANSFKSLCEKAFAKNRLFMGFSGNLKDTTAENLVKAFGVNEMGSENVKLNFSKTDCTVEIPAAVGYSALGHNIYALNSEFKGSCAVLSSLVSYVYLWNMIRVQGGAYGTGMRIRTNGDIVCYSYRDPNPENSKAVYEGIADFLEDFLSEGMPLDDLIIGAVNSTDPLLEPSALCASECNNYLSGITKEKLLKIRKELLSTTNENLLNLCKLIRAYSNSGSFCVVGDNEMISFAK